MKNYEKRDSMKWRFRLFQFYRCNYVKKQNPQTSVVRFSTKYDAHEADNKIKQ